MEAANCMRQEAKQTCSSAVASRPSSQSCSLQRKKVFNLQTYKIHALVDYPAQIRMYGTTDSFSTQIVCQFYRSDLSTGIFPRTSWSIKLAKAVISGQVTKSICLS